MPDLLPGATFAGCRIEAVAGRGGMGVVYRATQLSLGRPVALKLIASDRAAQNAFRERFVRESRLAASIDHPNVIPVHAAGEEDDRLYLVMRYVRGTDLQREMAQERRLAPARAAAIVAQVAAGLDAAHAAGLVHRDVKPANVLIGPDDHVYLTDFGLTVAQASDTRLTTTGQWIGTVDFMAPEHLRGGLTDARTDVYALGCVLHAALTGRPPFPRGTVPATMLAHLNDPPPRPSDAGGVPAEYDRVIARALAKAPDDRYPSAGDLGRAALAAARGEHVTESERTVARGEAAPGATLVLGGDPDGAGTQHAPTEVLAAAAPLDRETPRGAPHIHHAGRWRRLVAAGVAVIAAVVGIMVAASALGGGDAASELPGAAVSSDDARDAAQDFAAAYADEDDRSLARLLTPGVERVMPGARQQGRGAVLDVYRRQFADNDTTSYELQELDVSGGGPVGRAAGRYKATYGNGRDVTGSIAFGVVRDHGRARIGLISAVPDPV